MKRLFWFLFIIAFIVVGCAPYPELYYEDDILSTVDDRKFKYPATQISGVVREKYPAAETGVWGTRRPWIIIIESNDEQRLIAVNSVDWVKLKIGKEYNFHKIPPCTTDDCYSPPAYEYWSISVGRNDSQEKA